MSSQSKSGFFLGLIFFAAIFLWAAFSQAPTPELSLYFFDVGQGDSILIQKQNEQVLIDGGPSPKILEHLSRALPFGDKTIELAILSHNHADHLTGLNEVLKNYEVKEVWWSGTRYTTQEYQEWLNLLGQKSLNQKVVWRGENKDLPIGTQLTVVAPATNQEGKEPKNQHDSTVVIKLVYSQFSTLLTGDIEEPIEAEMVKEISPELKAQVLKVPHHGSNNGLLLEFLKVVNPEVAMISAGRNNSYGHPHQSTLKKLEEARVKTYRTDKDSTIKIETDGQKYWIETGKIRYNNSD
ncbi:MBL fold metallo-hydrolase [Candidatus Berkelbacteria bacterium]|nr:MBL fold metallo-hydrolase [Candidatus Berkelbacteria bacterium]